MDDKNLHTHLHNMALPYFCFALHIKWKLRLQTTFINIFHQMKKLIICQNFLAGQNFMEQHPHPCLSDTEDNAYLTP